MSSEFVLACDLCFTSSENTLLDQPEVGVGVNPGGGTERLPLLVGRGRALEIVPGANDFDSDTAERYGYVNRALPDAELDCFIDMLARRIASFDLRPIGAADHHGDLTNDDMETIRQVLYRRVALKVYVGVGVSIAHQDLFEPKPTGGMR